MLKNILNIAYAVVVLGSVLVSIISIYNGDPNWASIALVSLSAVYGTIPETKF